MLPATEKRKNFCGPINEYVYVTLKIKFVYNHTDNKFEQSNNSTFAAHFKDNRQLLDFKVNIST